MPAPAPPPQYRALTSLMATDPSVDPKTDLRGERWIPIGGVFEATDQGIIDQYMANGWIEDVTQVNPQQAPGKGEPSPTPAPTPTPLRPPGDPSRRS
jgi:hypothetical protein